MHRPGPATAPRRPVIPEPGWCGNDHSTRRRVAGGREVREWLATAAAVPGFLGFAVGRTTFWDALTDWRAGRITRQAAVAAIAGRYREWADIFERARAS
jgi:hypothetical protein